jgi:triacylglycerol lipase
MKTADLQAQVAKLGHRFDETILDATRRIYAALPAAPPDGLEVERDIAYGPAVRHRLDVYRTPGRNKPVLVFVHGGGFVAGDKHADDRFYGNLGQYFAGQGMVCVLINYRLAPADPWPAGAEDVARAVEWIAGQADRYGGDGQHLFVFGQSAGASHVATYLFDPAFHERATRSVKAAVLMSGFYTVAAPARPNIAAYFGQDPDAYAGRSPSAHVANSRVPVFLSVAEFDPGSMAQQTLALAQALTARDGHCPELAWFAGHNHVSTVLSLGSPQDDVGSRLTAYIRSFL